MPVPLLDLKAQHAVIKDAVVAEMLRVVDDQAFILGPAVERLERAVGELSQVRHAIGCASGTDALLLAFRALDIGRGDEVLTTPFTFFATAGTVHNVGATPVFADIEPETFNLDPELAAEAVTPRTKAVVPVDLFGQMAEIERFSILMPDMPIVEDAAQSIGARRTIAGKAVMAGQAATIGTLSFFPTKNLGGYGDGGMVLTQDDELAMRLRRLRVHGGAREYFHDEVGYNSRLDTLQAAVLLAKLAYLEGWSSKRREHARYYDQALADVPGVQTPVVRPENVSIFNQYTIRADRRDDLAAHLKKKGVGTKVYYPLPLHLQPCFSYLGYKPGRFPQSERAAAEVISLPIYPELTQAQLDETVAAIRSYYGR